MAIGRQIIFVLITLLGLLVAGCAATPAAAPNNVAANTTSSENAEQAVAAISEAINTDLQGEIDVVGSTTVQPLVELMRDEFVKQYPNIRMNVGAGGSVVGIEAVQDGRTDIGMASRKLDAEEQTEGMQVYPIAIDVLAVIIHPTNPVEGLSKAQLQGIFTGEITNWSEVGGPELNIDPVIREVTSGTRGAFDEIALDDAEPTANATVQITAGEVEAYVAANEDAIGYVGFGHIELDEIKVLTIDGVAPSPQNALDGSYALSRPLQLMTGPLTRELAQEFIDFALSPVGQRLVEEDGWVPVAGQTAGE
ncbi:MAG: phosphate ABC transporter substrate-binding protein [Chloroflexaceae bacterium]|nr:phosphate ABC transporter substrate-binding protein [Chloroflexaceae bacterium]NJO04387.1 phosphate ABC transporter substrate-binding protein [Chloroflexaceae bacterium]